LIIFKWVKILENKQQYIAFSYSEGDTLQMDLYEDRDCIG